MRSIVLLLLLLLVYVSSKKYNRLCVLRTNQGLIDLNGAYFDKDQRIRATRDLDLEFNVCDNTEKICGEKGYPSIISHWDTPEKCFSAGKAEASNDFRIYLIDSNDPRKGVILRYNHGDVFEQEGKLLEANTQLTIKCNASLTENTKPVREEPVVEGNIMLHRIVFSSKFSCPGVPPPVNNICVLKTTLGDIDLKKAAMSEDQIIFGRGFYDFTMNICKNITRDCKGKNNYTPILWHIFNDPTQCQASGRMDKSDDVELKLINQGNPTGGVILRYKNGDSWNQEGRIREGNGEIEIRCDPNSETVKPEFVDLVDDGKVVLYKFKSSSKHACPINPKK